MEVLSEEQEATLLKFGSHCTPIGVVENRATIGILYIRDGKPYHAWFCKFCGKKVLPERHWTSVDMPLQNVLESEESIREIAKERGHNLEEILVIIEKMKKYVGGNL